MNRTLVWFRRDLRLSDHAPLHRAARRGLVIPVFVFDRALLLHPETGAGRVRFMEARARRVERIDRQRHEVIHAPNVVPWITRLPEDVTPLWRRPLSERRKLNQAQRPVESDSGQLNLLV